MFNMVLNKPPIMKYWEKQFPKIMSNEASFYEKLVQYF